VSISLAATVLHPGFYKLGYVTNDRDRAIDVVQNQFGIEEFVRFEPKFDITTDDGRRGPISMACAFSAGRDLFIEILQPVEGLTDVFTSALSGGSEHELVFHHVGVIVDDIAAVKAAAAAQGLAPALDAALPSGMFVTYTYLPMFGHWVEHVQYDGDSRASLDGVAARPLRVR
jgi:Glyoxalase/Bleomycin resistance protein/Dioxygenase superfamily